MNRIGFGHCTQCDQVIAVYKARGGEVRVFRHGAQGLMGAFGRWPKCEGSYQRARDAKDRAGDELNTSSSRGGKA